MSNRTDEMARHLMRAADRLARSGKADQNRFTEQLTAALRERWPDIQMREIEESAIKFMALCDAVEHVKRPAGRSH